MTERAEKAEKAEKTGKPEKPEESTGTATATEAPCADADETVKFSLNGKHVEAPAGLNIIEAARLHGVDIPYFCYHPGLQPEGNCRMCLVEASNARRPITGCTTPVTDGLEVTTDNENILNARKAVLELMLVNHPLDCPICDKSGECMLQDHTYDHARAGSRMVEKKQLKHTKDLGKDIHIWGNRCIVCTRCVRFCNDVAGSGELCVVERGDRSVVDVFPEYPLQNNLSGNVVDLCPVGALISRDFLYQARVWFQKETPSVCTGCSRGCNVQLQTLNNQITRIVPRHNPDVNGYWMCDHGRYDFNYVLGERRTIQYRLGDGVRQEAAPQVLAEGLKKVRDEHGAAAVAGLASAFMTLEELYLFQSIFAHLGAPAANIGALRRPDGEEEVFTAFRIAADKNPNGQGVERLLGKEALTRTRQSIAEKIHSGAIKALLLVSDRPHCAFGVGENEAELLASLQELDFFAVIQLEGGAPWPDGTLVLPAAASSEKNGTMINEDGRVQRLTAATQLPRNITSELDLLQGVLMALEARDRLAPAEAIFQELRPRLGETAANLDYAALAKGGFSLNGKGKGDAS